MHDKPIDIYQAASYCGVSFQAIFKAMQRGSIKSRVVGRKRMTTIEWLEDWLDNKYNIETIKQGGVRVFDPGKGEFTVKQAAKMLGKLPRDIYRWIYIGKLKSLRKGEYHVIMQSEIDRMKESWRERNEWFYKYA